MPLAILLLAKLVRAKFPFLLHTYIWPPLFLPIAKVSKTWLNRKSSEPGMSQKRNHWNLSQEWFKFVSQWFIFCYMTVIEKCVCMWWPTLCELTKDSPAASQLLPGARWNIEAGQECRQAVALLPDLLQRCLNQTVGHCVSLCAAKILHYGQRHFITKVALSFFGAETLASRVCGP